MRIIMLGAPGPEKVHRQKKSLRNMGLRIFPQETFSVPTSKTAQSLARKQKPTWIRGFLFLMS